MNLENEIREIKERMERYEKNQEQILALLKPISETYRTAGTIGKWLRGLVIFASVVVGLLVGLKNLR